jgi:capsid assembly protease
MSNLAALKNTTWAIEHATLEQIIEFFQLEAAGVRVPYAAVDRPRERIIQRQVAVLPLFGTLSQRANMFTKISGATALEDFIVQFRALRNNSQIGAIILNVDSPGGSVFGVPEAAAEIYASRGIKRTIAVANAHALSGAYWIGSAAEELVITPSGLAGSIGLLGVFEDRSALEGKDGITHRIFRAGKYKAEGNEYEPLTDAAAAHLQSEVDRYYEMFVSAVAKHRSVTPVQVRNGYGQGRSVGARQAITAGMADRVATLDETIARIQGEIRSGVRRFSASAQRARLGYRASNSIDLEIEHRLALLHFA